MDGIINILKPPGMTSFDVVGYLRGVLKTRKIGHTGTLDPGAVGVLPICVGNATKAIEYMTEKDKVYRAELTLGSTTDTQDSTGELIEEKEVNVSSNEIIAVVKEFIGKIKQIPPMYSAIKVDGKKLYELARNGITVERESREIEIYSIDIIDIQPTKVIFDVACSKGTYIRTLCADIGEKLGCGGHMSFLVRLRAGNFDISSAITLEQVAEMAERGELDRCFSDIEQVFTVYKSLTLNQTEEKKFLNGVPINVGADGLSDGQLVRVYNSGSQLLALGQITSKQNQNFLKSKKMLKVY